MIKTEVQDRQRIANVNYVLSMRGEDIVVSGIESGIQVGFCPGTHLLVTAYGQLFRVVLFSDWSNAYQKTDEQIAEAIVITLEANPLYNGIKVLRT